MPATRPIAFGNQFGWPAIHYLTQLNAYDVPPATLAKDYDPSTGAFTDPGYVTGSTELPVDRQTCSNPSANGLSHEAAQANFLNGKAAMHYLEPVEFPVLTEKGGASEVADNWDFFRLPARHRRTRGHERAHRRTRTASWSTGTKHAALAVDFLKFMTSMDNAEKMTGRLGWLSPVKGSATAENSFPQQSVALDDISKASEYAIWLDTVTNADVANAYLSGVEGILDGSQTPQEVIQPSSRLRPRPRSRQTEPEPLRRPSAGLA